MQVLLKYIATNKNNQNFQKADPAEHQPPEIVGKYKQMNDEYVSQAPVKTEEATLIRKIIAMDIQFLYGCGLSWNAVVPEQEHTGGR